MSDNKAHDATMDLQQQILTTLALLATDLSPAQRVAVDDAMRDATSAWLQTAYERGYRACRREAIAAVRAYDDTKIVSLPPFARALRIDLSPLLVDLRALGGYEFGGEGFASANDGQPRAPSATAPAKRPTRGDT